MAKGFKHGAGGSNVLNFKVVGNPQPTNPRENTIWIDTDTKITGYQFSAEYQGKNLLKNTLTSKTVDGVTFTVNADGSVHVYGTPGHTYVSTGVISIKLPKGAYTVSGGQASSGKAYFQIVSVSNSGETSYFVNRDFVVTGTESYIHASITTGSHTSFIDYIVYPMIRLAGTDDTYEPYGAAKEGFVWISTSFYSTSEFNALKKNGIQVYPSYAKQYVNSTWVTKEVKIYQGGAWKQPWDGKLFSGGAFRVISGFNGDGVGATVRIEGSNLFFNADNEYAWPHSKEQIDLTDVKTIVVKMESPSYTWYSDPWDSFGVTKSIPSTNEMNFTAKKRFNTSDPRGEYALDVSSLTGNYYLMFAMSDTSGKAAVYYISEIRLER